MHSIPILKLSEFVTDQTQFIDQLHNACSDIGFFSITDHGICPSLMKEMRIVLQEFFSLPLIEKEKMIITRDNY